MSSGWGCPNESKGMCMKVGGAVTCDPGMKGCVLFGRFRFSTESKNKPAGLRTPQVPKPTVPPQSESGPGTE